MKILRGFREKIKDGTYGDFISFGSSAELINAKASDGSTKTLQQILDSNLKKHLFITQEEYDALSESEKMDENSVYFVN